MVSGLPRLRSYLPSRMLVHAAMLAVVCTAAIAQTIFRPETCGGRRWVPYEPTVMSFGLTPEQAADRVRAWMQDPNLQLQVVGIATDRTDDYLQADPWPTWDWDLQYMLQDLDEKRYFVRIHPWVSVAYYDMTADTPCGLDPSLYIGDAQRQAVAEAFIRGRSPDLWGAENQQMHYGRVMARYQGVCHPLRYAACSVHPETGALIQCVLADPGVPTVPLTPTVSAAAAQGIAIPFLLQAAAYAATAPSNAGGREQHLFLYSDPLTLVHRLAWSVPLTATGDDPPTPDSIWFEHDVYVDAHTGEPFFIETYLGANETPPAGSAVRRARTAASVPTLLQLWLGKRELRTAMPPILVEGRPYLWAGWLRSPLLQGDGTAVTYASKRLVVRRGAKTRTFSVYAGGAQPQPRSCSSVVALVRGGRCYLPLDAVRQLTTLPVWFDTSSRAVRFGPARSAARRGRVAERH